MKKTIEFWECSCRSMVINLSLLPITAYNLIQFLISTPAVLRL